MTRGLAARVAAWQRRLGDTLGPAAPAGSQAAKTMVELQLGGSWVNITEYVYYRDRMTITRGRTDEGAQVERSTCRLTLDNRDGRFSPRNPAGAWYGLIGRNTGLRVSVDYQGGRAYRFHGEVSTWPVRWDLSGTDVYVSIEASGILRRLGQGATPIKSAPRRYVPTTGPAAYWPLDDGHGTNLSLPVVGEHPIRAIGSGIRHFATEPLAPWLEPTIITDTTSSVLIGGVSGVNGINGWAVDLLIRTHDNTGSGSLELRADNRIWFVDVDPVAAQIQVQRTTDGVNDVGPDLSPIIESARNTKVHHLRFSTQTPDWKVFWDGVLVHSGTFTLGNKGISEVRLYSLIGSARWGHLAIWDTLGAAPVLADAVGAAFGHDSETTGRRIERLCAEESIEFTPVGDLDDTTALGPQYPDTLVSILREAATTDAGILFETRQRLGLGYRTRRSLYNQTPRLVLDYSASHFLAELDPIDDDQATRNDVTVNRRDGSFARDVLEIGPLSVQAPPGGVGRYDEQVTVNVAGDGFLPDQASWRLHVGTVDETRFPVLGGKLTEVSEGLRLSLFDTDLGDRVTIASPPAWLPPDTISVIVQGSAETVDDIVHELAFSTSPESPYQVATYDQAHRYDTSGTTLTTAVDTDDTTLMVSTIGGILWSTTAEPYDIAVGGERMMVTACTGVANPQTMIVTRSVNAVVRSHLAGTAVSLFSPARYAL